MMFFMKGRAEIVLLEGGVLILSFLMAQEMIIQY